MENKMIINGETPFQVPTDKFSVQCESGYTLYYSVTGPMFEDYGEEGYEGYSYDTSVWQASDQTPNEYTTIYDAGVKGMWFKLVDNTEDAIIRY